MLITAFGMLLVFVTLNHNACEMVFDVQTQYVLSVVLIHVVPAVYPEFASSLGDGSRVAV